MREEEGKVRRTGEPERGGDREGTNKNVWESESNDEVCQPIHDGCYSDREWSSLLKKQLRHHQPWNGTCEVEIGGTYLLAAHTHLDQEQIEQ